MVEFAGTGSKAGLHWEWVSIAWTGRESGNWCGIISCVGVDRGWNCDWSLRELGLKRAFTESGVARLGLSGVARLGLSVDLACTGS